MQVSLINFTNDARELLIYTKNTRLKEGTSLDDIKAWSEERKQLEIDYIMKTIQSSWEFVDYTFSITGVSRAFTHQFVRTRTGTYAQLSQRTVDESDFEFTTPEMNEELRMTYFKTMDHIKEGYKKMLEQGANPQMARGLLPTNVSTSIIAKFNLRTLSDMAHKRLCTRTQGEYQQVFKEMKKRVVEVHPWAERFIQVYCAAVGVCQFPNYKECPLKPAIFNPASGRRWDQTEGYTLPRSIIDCQETEYTLIKRPATTDEIQAGFEKMQFEATPKWKGNS